MILDEIYMQKEGKKGHFKEGLYFSFVRNKIRAVLMLRNLRNYVRQWFYIVISRD